MATTTVEQEIVELENEYWNSLKNKDTRASLRLTDEPCIVVGPQGAANLDHKAFEKMAQSGNWELKDFELRDVQVRQLTDDVAVVAYDVTENMTVDGKPLKLQASDASVWIRRDGRWLCTLHTESITGDPFGRDRVSGNGAEARPPQQRPQSR